MKVEIDENGELTITPETPLESYALSKWCEDNTVTGKIIIKKEMVTDETQKAV